MTFSCKSNIPYTRPSITESEIAYATDAARNGWGAQCYAYIDRFEKDFTSYLKVKHGIATSSCTGAMHMGLSALGISEGDEVILAETNWIATVAPIKHLGATPVFVDILPDTWCLDPDKVEAAITSKTKAIIATHIYGNLCDMNKLLAIGNKYNVSVIEDAAEALGAIYQEQPAGSIGQFGTFSFHGTKTLTTGEGGIFVTNDTELFEKVLTLSNHGRDKRQSLQFWPDEIGFKYKMSNIQAAIGCAQLERIEDLTSRKHEVLTAYKTKLSGYQGISFNPEPAGTVNGAWMPTAVFDPELGVTRDMLLEAFKAQNIDARVFFYPLSGLSFFEGKPENVNAWDIPERAINLPSFHDISDLEIDRVCNVIKSLVK